MNHQNGIWNKIFIFIIITMMWLQSGIHKPAVPGGPRMHSKFESQINWQSFEDVIMVFDLLMAHQTPEKPIQCNIKNVMIGISAIPTPWTKILLITPGARLSI